MNCLSPIVLGLSTLIVSNCNMMRMMFTTQTNPPCSLRERFSRCDPLHLAVAQGLDVLQGGTARGGTATVPFGSRTSMAFTPGWQRAMAFWFCSTQAFFFTCTGEVLSKALAQIWALWIMMMDYVLTCCKVEDWQWMAVVIFCRFL